MASRQLHLCVRDFSALTPVADLLVRHLIAVDGPADAAVEAFALPPEAAR